MATDGKVVSLSTWGRSGEPPPRLARVEAALAALRRGEPVIVADGEDRENEGDLILAAERATPEALAFMVRHTSGLICVGMAPARLDALGIGLMVPANSEALGTAFTVSVDVLAGTTTGISAADRAATVAALVDPAATGADFARPGHVFPLRARPGGVLERPGHTEASVDLARLAGLAPAGALCEIVNEDGTMARRDDLARFAAEHALAMITIEDIVAYRRYHERLVNRLADAPVGTAHGPAVVYAYESLPDGVEHVAVVYGQPWTDGPVLVRMHSECLTGDLFDSSRCDCGPQLERAKDLIGAEGAGIIVYLRGHEGRGIGLARKLAAYGLQDAGADTVDANTELGLPVDARHYNAAAQILADLGVRSVRLLTNNPQKCAELADYGLQVRRVALCTLPTRQNLAYLETKRRRMGHQLALGDVLTREQIRHATEAALSQSFAW